ncbi:carotenoid 1,2-hydratase, partial [SAR202 cluster bacterium AD-804-J14_MRT_500m]|nr:carotenoid 1,2-hydratase [SAR202 cluster bacterium AD-804-J14_MRT_500m]
AMKPAVLHGGDGYIEYGDVGGSYYYSYPRINTSGIVIDNGIEEQVNGISWMDHQWGDAILSELGWDWFNLQLNDGTELMYYQLRDRNGEVMHEFGTMIDAQGEASNIEQDSIYIEPLGIWESETSGATYPSGWHFQIDQDISLMLSPVVEESEFYIPGSILPVYWEGAVKVSGHGAGNVKQGYGFVELVGYMSP